MDNKNSFTFAGLFGEITIVIVLVLTILTTLNYFKIIPLSSTFPFLSFLPQQQKIQFKTPISISSPPATLNRSITSRLLISPLENKIFNNKTINNQYIGVNKSAIKPTNSLRIDVEMSVSLLDNDATGSSGLIFKNNFPYEKQEYRHVRMFYYAKAKNWLLEFRSQGKSNYFLIAKAPTNGVNFIKFALLIDKKGKNITAIVPGVSSRTFKLADSLYANSRQMNMFAQVAPHSQLNIYSLSYQY